MFSNNKVTITKGLLRPALMVALLGLAAPALASNPVVGQLTVVNGVANVVNGSTGGTASSVSVVVSDSTGPCSTTNTLAYRGTVTVSWNAANTHSSSSCTNIVSVAVSALKTVAGTVQYDSTANATPPATATAATVFTAPTTAITNLTLIVTGGASAATTNSATVWGSALGVEPAYDATNGGLLTTGIMGSVGAAGVDAEAVMRNYAIRPMSSDAWV